jgi:pimeloyl-ACP methyl ester carboxylesterase
MAFFKLPRIPEAMLQAGNYAQMGLSLRAFGLPSTAWQRDRRQLQRVGMRGPLNWYRGATKGLRPRRVSVPTLYVWGSRDPFLGRKAAELTGKYVTGPYRFEELKAGHWIPDRNAADLQRALGEHLEDFSEPAPVAERALAGRSAAAAKSDSTAKTSAKRATRKRTSKPRSNKS